jgi:hypothetical protein
MVGFVSMPALDYRVLDVSFGYVQIHSIFCYKPVHNKDNTTEFSFVAVTAATAEYICNGQ